jgi:RNA polymerase sigma-32 factor
MIAKRLGVNENDVVDMNRCLGGDVSLNTLVHADEAGEAQDWLVDPAPSPEAVYADQEEVKQRRQALTGALEVLNTRERGIFEARFLSEPAVRLEELATRFGISRERVRRKSSGYGMRPTGERLHDATVKQRRGNDCRGPEAVPGG